MIHENERKVPLMAGTLAMTVVVLAIGQETPAWLKWTCIGVSLVILMLMVSSAGASRAQLFEATTRLRQVRRERDEVEGYFRTLMESLPTWIYFKDRESRFLKVSEALAKHFGLPAVELIGKTDSDFLDAESAKNNKADELAILDSGVGRERFIEKERMRDGEDAWVLTSKLAIRDKEGRIIGTVGISNNVTELIEAQQNLERERNTLRTLIDSIPDSIYIRDSTGKYLEANSALAELVGEPGPQQVTGKTPHDFFPQDAAQSFVREDMKVITSGKTISNARSIVLNSKGEQRHMRTTKVPMKDHEGKYFAVLAINRDVTEEEKAREAVRQTEHRMQEIVDASPSPMYAKSVNGQYLMVNRRYEELFKLKAEDVVGKTDKEVIEDKELVSLLMENDALVLERGEPVQFDEKLTFPDGEHSYVSTKFPMRDLDGEIYAVGGISTDITERKEAERKLQQLNQELMKTHENLTNAHEQLIQAEKMESVGRLAAGVAHEVKNPLAMIGMGLELLNRRIPDDDEKSKETIIRMKRGIDRAKKIVRGLVDYSSNRKIEFRPVKVSTLVTEAIELVEYELKKGGIKIDFQPDHELPEVEVDQTKIEQVLVNMFINAMHSMDGAGLLTVRIDSLSMENVVHDEGSRLRERMRKGDVMVRITVTDTGKGIPEELLGKIFDPFFTTKSTGKGTGLGLTVSRKIVEMHGGELTLANRTDAQGVIAILTLRTTQN